MVVSDLRVADIRTEMQKTIEQRNVIENKLKEEAKEPGLVCVSPPFFVKHVI